MTKGPKMSEVLGRNIRLFREKHGLTQYDLAAQVGVAQPCISNYELGRVTNIDLDLMALIAQALGIRLGQLYDPKPPVNLYDGVNPELLDASVNYQYVFNVSGRKVRVVTSKEITPGKPVGRYVSRCFDVNSGTEIDDAELGRILRSKIGEIIPVLREQRESQKSNDQ